MFSSQRKQNLEFLTIQNYTLKKIGVDINTLECKELLQNYFKFTFLIICVMYVEMGLINFVMHSGIAHFDMASGSLSIFNQGGLVLLKLTIFLTLGERFMKLIWGINRLAEEANDLEKKEWLRENLRSQLIGKIYFYTCWAVVGCSGICPLIIMAFDYKQNLKLNGKLPFGGRFPYQNISIFFFIGNYILTLIYIYGLLNMTVGIDALYVWYIHSISAHFRILRCKVARVALELQKNNCANFAHGIGSIVAYHNHILEFVQDLNAIFGVILWAEVMFSSLQMCFALYTLNKDDNVFNMPLNIMILVAGFMQMTIYCFGGEKIKSESSLLSLDFYLSFPWHAMRPKEKKLMLLPLMRSQRLSVLRGLFFEIDRNLLVYILKTAFSFNALLSAIKE